MFLFGLYMLVFIYLIIWGAFFFVAYLFRKHIETDINTTVAIKKTLYVLALFSIIYFVPITAMIICAFIKPILIYIIGFSMVLSAIPVAYLIIIPLLDRRTQNLRETYYKN